jgi:hypothetical protein
MKTATKNLTEMETAVLKAFADNEYTALEGQYSNPEIKKGQWMFAIKDASGLSNASFSGVVGSLVKKGFVTTDTEGDRGMMGVSIQDTWSMGMTEEGFKALQTI